MSHKNCYAASLPSLHLILPSLEIKASGLPWEWRNPNPHPQPLFSLKAVKSEYIVHSQAVKVPKEESVVRQPLGFLVTPVERTISVEGSGFIDALSVPAEWTAVCCSSPHGSISEPHFFGPPPYYFFFF